MDAATPREAAWDHRQSDPRARYFPYTYGLMHALVDAITVLAVFSTIFVHRMTAYWGFYLVIAYDVLAFAGQALLGHLVDRFRFSRGAVQLGLLFSALAVVLLTMEPFTAVLAAGVGNALFHVGAGALSLYVKPGRATPPGIFVAPGALGLALGLWLGRGGMFHVWLILGLLAMAFVYTFFSTNPRIPTRKEAPRLDIRAPVLLIGLLLLSIAVRSFVGYAGGYACPKRDWIPLAFALTAFAGKGLGGIVSDRLGWILTSVGALLISAPLIAFFGSTPGLLIAGLFFFQMTMPVTLVAIAVIIPGRPGFAFGLACLVLVMGAIPTFFRSVHTVYHPVTLLVLILLSAGVLFVALRLLRAKVPMRF